MMTVQIRRARKKCTCAYEGCPKQREVLNGEYFVVCQWMMNTRSGKHWLKRKSFHTQCWIQQGIEAIEQRPVVETRGYGGRLAITDAGREKRLKVLRKRASVVQRIKAAILEGRYALVDKLMEQLERCKEEIEQYGGVPKKW